MARLLLAQNVARSANLQIPHRDLKSGSELRILLDGVQPLPGVIFQGSVLGNQQVAVGLVMTAAHPTSQLMQLRQSEAIGSLHDERIGTRYIQATLDDRGRDENIGFLVDELQHPVFQFVLIHLSVCDNSDRFRE